MKRIFSRILFFIVFFAFSNVSMASHIGQLAITTGSSFGIITDDFKKKFFEKNDNEISKMNFNAYMTAYGGYFKYHYLSDSFFAWALQLGYLYRNLYIGFSNRDPDSKGFSLGSSDSRHIIRFLNGPAINFLSDSNDDDYDSSKFILGLLIGTSIDIHTKLKYQNSSNNSLEKYERGCLVTAIAGLNIEYISSSGFFGSIVPTFEAFKQPLINSTSNSENRNDDGILYFINLELQIGWKIFNI